MPPIGTVWMRFSTLIKKLRGFDARQCNESRNRYNRHCTQGTRDDASRATGTGSEHDVVIEYHRADQAKIGQNLRDRYREVAEEELPRDILNTLADLNQRLKRRDGE